MHHYCTSDKSFIALMSERIGTRSRAIIAFLFKVTQHCGIPEFLL